MKRRTLINVWHICGIGYCLVTLLMFAMINYEGAAGFQPMTVPYIEGKVVILHACMLAIFSVFFFSLLIIKRSGLRMDVVSWCLIAKFIFDILSGLINDVDIMAYPVNFLHAPFAFLSYTILINSKIDDKRRKQIKLLFLFFGYILSLQVIYTAVFCGISYFDILYKGYIKIPFGATNVIASILVPILCMAVIEPWKPQWKVVTALLLGVAIFLTKSRGGMVLLCASIFAIMYSKATGRNRNILRVALVCAAIFLFFAILKNDYAMSLLRGYADAIGSMSLDALSSGRVKNWSILLAAFLNGNWLLGAGMQPPIGNIAGAHNIIIDLLYRCGIIGTIVYAVMIGYLIRCGRRINRCGAKSSFFAMMIIILVNSLYEVCYFSYPCDTLFWIIAGALMSEYYGIAAYEVKECRK